MKIQVMTDSEENVFHGFKEQEVPGGRDLIRNYEESKAAYKETRSKSVEAKLTCEDEFCEGRICGINVLHGKPRLMHEIQAAINNLNVNRVSSKDIRLAVQETLGISLESKKKDFDSLVMKVFSQQDDFRRAKPVNPKVSAKRQKEIKKQNNEVKRANYEAAAQAWLRGEYDREK